MPSRPHHFPQPWTPQWRVFHRPRPKLPALIFVHFEDEPGRWISAKQLTRDEARRIAANIAKLLELLKRPQY
jgi:hypothetical protein